MILAHNGILPPKIAMTLFNDTDERDDYEIRNGEFVGFLWAVAYIFCVALMVTHLFMWKWVWFLEMTSNHCSQFGEWDEDCSVVENILGKKMNDDCNYIKTFLKVKRWEENKRSI